MISSAVFSACRKYRYVLHRIWNEKKPFVMFVGLNPSTANEKTNDPTVARCVRFADSWDYGGMVTNTFAYVSTDPNALLAIPDTIGLENNSYLAKTAKEAAKKFLTDENSKCQTAIVMESVLAFERPEPQIVEHNLSGRRRRRVVPAAEKKPAEKKRKAKEAPKDEEPVGMIPARPDSIPDPNLLYCRDCRPEGYEWGKSSVGTCSICHAPLRQVRRVK
jgi:hypothetical protein